MRPISSVPAAVRWLLQPFMVLTLMLGLAVARPAQSADQAEIDQLWTLLLMPEVLGIMHAEGIDYGESLDRDMLGGQGGDDWAAEVAAIYDIEWMTRTSRAAFGQALAGVDVSDGIAFFSSELGARAVRLEYEARKAMLDPEADELARVRVQEMRDRALPWIDQLTRFAEVNDLFESNVAGALNANYAFFKGLASGGALDPEMDDSAILAEVWAQEPGVRADTIDWVYSFLNLAYQPLTDAELDAYIAFSETPGGQTLNRAIFSAFDGMFNDISFALGAGLARRMVGEEL
ncbi:hypothetical protein [Frigidibacter sp. ROC022]|uniref:hypothetical protein n=1 Tax=Frigidibacter sp. ROC022 TaxID=2971796 RepID=UPI00215A48DA|nr:hypothetical protein [Frigidibacter sp. ROC022]MCR8723911.1 hypothetical protein [Frigidibacter sp. ROC022]